MRSRKRGDANLLKIIKKKVILIMFFPNEGSLNALGQVQPSFLGIKNLPV